MNEKERARKLYEASFGKEKHLLDYFSHGRLELIGNHTDHNGGLSLASAVSLGIFAAVCPNNDDVVRIASEGFKPVSFHLDELKLRPGEEGSSASLVKGVLLTLRQKGRRIGGFSAALTSNLAPGSGVSSSAAFSVLIAKIIDDLYNEGLFPAFEIAEVAKEAENRYFGKPSGMLDQIGCANGGVCYIDFLPEKPKVEHVPWNLNLKVFLINTGSSHADLTHLYAGIRTDMESCAKLLFGKDRLGECNHSDFMLAISRYREGLSERAKLRGQHFFDENQRVKDAFKAIKEKDEATFLNLIRGSQMSMASYLGNTMVPGIYDHSPQQCVDLAANYIGKGAVRMMGGGFGGSVLAFLYPEDVHDFVENMAKYYGHENIIPVEIPATGPGRI